MRKRALLPIFCVKLAVSASLIWLLFARIPFRAIWAHISTADPVYIAATAPITILTSILSAQRWSLLSLGLIGFGNALRYTWIGMFYGAVLPGGISGDVAKGASLAISRRDTRVTQLPASIAFDRLVGLSALVLILNLCCLPIALSWIPVQHDILNLCRWGFVVSFVAVLACVCILTRAGRNALQGIIHCLPRRLLRSRVEKVFELFSRVARDGALLWRIYGLSVCIHMLNIVTYYLILRALSTRFNIEEVAIYYAGMSAIVMAPISISGIGIREWVSLIYFTALGLNGDLGVAFSWISLALGTAAAGIGGLVQLTELLYGGDRNAD